MYVILIAAMLFVSATLAGIFAHPFQEGKVMTQNPNLYKCCNTGDGRDCKPDPSVQTITYKGEEYGLLKSNVYLKNMNEKEHSDPARDASGNLIQVNGELVLLNVIPEKKTEQGVTHPPFCDRPSPDRGWDWLYVQKDPRDTSNKDYSCQRIPDDMLIYLCRKDNPPGECQTVEQKGNLGLDVWIRLRDIRNTTIQEKYPFLATCYKPETPNTAGEQKIKFRPSPAGQDNLQLRTFMFTEPGVESEWLNPYCKPAIYLYPERRSEIKVTVAPKGEMLLTIPPYPPQGWNVVAEPNGDIYYQKERFDYLYYEASIPDQLITKPQKGYVIPYEEREALMLDLITRLGLNEKERKDFLEYWVPILPKSPYYFIGVVPQTQLDFISPVSITPEPKTFFRITLYFQPLEQREEVEPPLIMPLPRKGFTAIEWGGIVKQDKNHPFSCFM